MRIYFARHGESEANVLRVFSNRGRKHGLTEKGRIQAESLASKVSAENVERVITSPLLRASETAQIVATILGLAVEEAAELREWDVGVFEGRSDEEAWQRYWRLRQDWQAGRLDLRIEEGESRNDVAARFVPFVERLVGESSENSRVLLVSHGGLYSAALPLVLSNIDADFAERNPLDNASVVVAESTQNGFVCRRWAAIDRLPA